MAEQIIVFDTTLRDGEQAPGINLNAKAKVEIAEQLARLGVDVIEAGFPQASVGDFEAVRAVAERVKGATIAALARTAPGDVDRAAEALAPARHMVFMFYEDRPGVIGRVGTLLGKSGVNIAQMQVGRRKQGGEALMALTVDAGIPAGVLDRVEREVGAHEATFIQLTQTGAGA